MSCTGQVQNGFYASAMSFTGCRTWSGARRGQVPDMGRCQTWPRLFYFGNSAGAAAPAPPVGRELLPRKAWKKFNFVQWDSEEIITQFRWPSRYNDTGMFSPTSPKGKFTGKISTGYDLYDSLDKNRGTRPARGKSIDAQMNRSFQNEKKFDDDVVRSLKI